MNLIVMFILLIFCFAIAVLGMIFLSSLINISITESIESDMKNHAKLINK